MSVIWIKQKQFQMKAQNPRTFNYLTYIWYTEFFCVCEKRATLCQLKVEQSSANTHFGCVHIEVVSTLTALTVKVLSVKFMP